MSINHPVLLIWLQNATYSEYYESSLLYTYTRKLSIRCMKNEDDTDVPKHVGLVQEYTDGLVTFVFVWFNKCMTYTKSIRQLTVRADDKRLHCSRDATSCYQVLDGSLLSVKPFGTSPNEHQTTYKQGVDTKNATRSVYDCTVEDVEYICNKFSLSVTHSRHLVVIILRCCARMAIL